MAGIRSTSTRLAFGVATLAVVLAMLAPVGASAAEDDEALDMYTADVSTEQATDLVDCALGHSELAIVVAIRSRGTTCTAAPRRCAARGIPNTTDVA